MASVSEIASASDLQMDYMKLLVKQLQNQNPLEPMSNEQMASQLAQFSQLQQLESMSRNFSEVLSATNRSYANSLIGKRISFMDTTSSDGEVTSAVVDKVFNNVDGDIVLVAGDYQMTLDEVISIQN